MEGETPKKDGGGDSPKPKRRKMVNVYNDSRTANIHLGGGRKIPPKTSGKIPLGVYEKLKHLQWVKRAERGDVIK